MAAALVRRAGLLVCCAVVAMTACSTRSARPSRYTRTRTPRTALEQLGAQLDACVALHDPNYDFKLDKPDPSTLRITDTGWSHQYRAKGSVLM
jgi:hypothetical protein